MLYKLYHLSEDETGKGEEDGIPFESLHDTRDTARLLLFIGTMRKIASDHYGQPTDVFLCYRKDCLRLSAFCLGAMSGMVLAKLVPDMDPADTYRLASELADKGLPIHDMPTNRFA